MEYKKELELHLEKINTKFSKRKILIIDGDDNRAIEVAKLFKGNDLLEITLLVEQEITNLDSNIKQEIMTSAKKEEYANAFFEFRNGKETQENALAAMQTRPFYGMMMLRNNEVDGVIGGLNYTTADILRAAFKVIGPKKGIKTISSAMIMHKENERYIFSDISVNIKPTAEQLAEIGQNATEFAKSLGIDPRIAFLSFSTNGSAKSDESILVSQATEIYNANTNEVKAIGEVQFDAAFDLEVRKSKYKKDFYQERTNVFVFPTLDAGNIGYKIAQRLGNFGAIGPIITGINKPINDLSRGATAEDVYNTALITALQTIKEGE